DGGLGMGYNDTRSDFDGGGLHFVRQVSGTGISGSGVSGKAAAVNPVTDASSDANWPHYAPGGAGATLPHLDLTGLRVSNPDAHTLRIKMTVKSLAQLT